MLRGKRVRQSDKKFDVAIVGSGPAGLSAAGRAAELGLSHILLEKTDHLSDTIFCYQKGKHIMATPDALVLRSEFEFEAGSREDILDRWNSKADDVNVKVNAEVIEIKGEKENFIIKTKAGDTIEARHVVLGIGTQGNPNTMRCPGGDKPHIQYSLDDPDAYFDEDIIVIGAGDAGIENALGLIRRPELENRVIIMNRRAEFARAKDANVKALMSAAADGRMTIMTESETQEVHDKLADVSTKDGVVTVAADRIIARLGSAPPRKFIEACGVEFASPDRLAYPTLSPQFETSVPGLYVIGALAGYPLIKHCMNQGYDVIENINGNTELKPADEPLLVHVFRALPNPDAVSEWLEFLRTNVKIFNGLTPLQMREFMLDSKVHVFDPKKTIFRRNDVGDSLFCIAEGAVAVRIDPNDLSKTITIPEGEIFGEAGLISGRRRNATIFAETRSVLVEVPRNVARKLLATVPSVQASVDRTATERLLLAILGQGLQKDDLTEIMETAALETVQAGEYLIKEDAEDADVFIIRVGSMVVEKEIAGRNVFLAYVPAGAYVGEMAMLEDGRRTASVKAAVKSEVIRLKGDAFKALLAAKPQLRASVMEKFADRRALNSYIEANKDSFDGVADMFTARANFLMKQGLGEATDALLIDEKLCIGCDNCEVACAESHDGISRLDREAGTTFDHLHVPTSCRHCEHPHCMSDCPPNAIRRAPDGEVFIDDTCIGCGNCERYCPYGVIQMARPAPKKPGLFSWIAMGAGPGPGQPPKAWIKKKAKGKAEAGPKQAVKCDMCKGITGGAACVRACPTGAAIRVSPEEFLDASRSKSR